MNPDCNHADMRKTETQWVCHCGLTIDRKPDRESYLAAARAALKNTEETP